ncbi:MAG: response regulator, partial [Calditrichaeota bacterium]
MKVLILDDSKEYVESLSRALRRDFEIVAALNLQDAENKMNHNIPIALVDVRLSEEDADNRDGILFLKWVKEKYPEVHVIIMSAYQDYDAAVDALNLGAEYYLKKPINLRE